MALNNLVPIKPDSEAEIAGSDIPAAKPEPKLLDHPITLQSFAVIDREIGEHNFTPEEYAVIRRAIHATADFDFQHLMQFSPGAIQRAIAAIADGKPIVVDVGTVERGIQGLVNRTFRNPIVNALDFAGERVAGRDLPAAPTRTAAGMQYCLARYPDALYVVGNAPTALLAICDRASQVAQIAPSAIVGVPVGFVSVVESKAALAGSGLPYILSSGRKGGSPVAAAIVNALIVLAWSVE